MRKLRFVRFGIVAASCTLLQLVILACLVRVGVNEIAGRSFQPDRIVIVRKPAERKPEPAEREAEPARERPARPRRAPTLREIAGRSFR